MMADDIGIKIAKTDSIHADMVAKLNNNQVMVVKKAKSMLNEVRRIRLMEIGYQGPVLGHYEMLISDKESDEVTYASVKDADTSNYTMDYFDDIKLKQIACSIAIGSDVIVGWE